MKLHKFGTQLTSKLGFPMPQAGPGRISRWARARPAPEAVETAAVAVPGLVEEDALAVAQLDRQRKGGG